MAATAAELIRSYFVAGDLKRIIDVSSPLIELLEKTQKQAELFDAPIIPYCDLCSYTGLSLSFMGDFVQGEALCTKALRVAEDASHLSTLAIMESNLGWLYFFMGDGKGAMEHCEKAVSQHEETQSLITMGFAWTGAGLGYCFLGELEVARSYAEKGLSIHLSHGNPFFLSLHYWLLGMVDLASGDFKLAQTNTEKGLELSRQNNERFVVSALELLLGKILVAADPTQIDEAEKLILDGIKIANNFGYKYQHSLGRFSLGEVYADTGQRENAFENLKMAEEMFNDMGLDYWIGKTQEVLGRL